MTARSKASQKDLDRRLKATFGLSIERYADLEQRQGGRCRICRLEPPKGKRLYVDHSHDTGAVRGLLCSNCNAGLGFFRDSPDNLRAAADYLQRPLIRNT